MEVAWDQSRKADKMNPRVRNLYKRVLVMGRDWPGGMAYVRRKAKVSDQLLRRSCICSLADIIFDYMIQNRKNSERMHISQMSGRSSEQWDEV